MARTAGPARLGDPGDHPGRHPRLLRVHPAGAHRRGRARRNAAAGAGRPAARTVDRSGPAGRGGPRTDPDRGAGTRRRPLGAGRGDRAVRADRAHRPPGRAGGRRPGERLGRAPVGHRSGRPAGTDRRARGNDAGRRRTGDPAATSGAATAAGRRPNRAAGRRTGRTTGARLSAASRLAHRSRCTAVRPVRHRPAPAVVPGHPVAGADGDAGPAGAGRGARRGAGARGLPAARARRHRLVPRRADPGGRGRRRGTADHRRATTHRALGTYRLDGGGAGADVGAGLPERVVAGDLLRPRRTGVRGAGNRRWSGVRSILYSTVAAPFAAFRGLPWVRRHVGGPARPARVRRIAWSVVVTVLVLIVFGALLSSADAAFSVLLGDLSPDINGGSVFRWVFLLAVGGLIAVAAVYTISAPPDLSTVDSPGVRRLGPTEWALPIGALVLLFAGFVAVQFTVLFGGQQHVLKTAGLNYAEYARSGFWQLVVVTLLTLAVLGAVTRWAQRERPVERILLRVLLGLLSALSVVIVVSALSRLYTYQKVYSFTGERIFVMAFELLLGTIFLMIMAAGIRWRGAWIPRLTVGLAVAMLLSLAVLNPEDYAARRNVTRYQQAGKIDAWYLRALSADATPALATLPDPVRRCTLSWIAKDLKEPDAWNVWNLGRARARAELRRLGPGAIGGPRDCRAADQFDLPKTRNR
ncbi:DUF4153 domain-containing protein [Micromonospora zhanjiangensis]